MSLKKYIESRKASVQSHLMVHAEFKNDSEEFPCKACGGSGFLLRNCTISRPGTPTVPIEHNGKPISFMDPMNCPSCGATGVDHDALIQSAAQLQKEGP